MLSYPFESDEILVSCDEVGLARHLEDDCLSVLDQGEHTTIVRGTTGSLGDRGEPHLLQDLLGLGEIAIGLDQGLLAIHHASAGGITQFLYDISGNFHNILLAINYYSS
jgi:hypothetical protein